MIDRCFVFFEPQGSVIRASRVGNSGFGVAIRTGIAILDGRAHRLAELVRELGVRVWIGSLARQVVSRREAGKAC